MPARVARDCTQLHAVTWTASRVLLETVIVCAEPRHGGRADGTTRFRRGNCRYGWRATGDLVKSRRACGTSAGRWKDPEERIRPSVPGESVTITKVEGARCQLLGHVERRASHSESEVVEVTGATGRQTLTLRANARASSHLPGFDCEPFFSR